MRQLARLMADELETSAGIFMLENVNRLQRFEVFAEAETRVCSNGKMSVR